MPNWVFNSLVIEAEPQAINKIKAQLSAPYETEHVDWQTNEVVKTMVEQPLSYWNIIKPTNLEAYHDKPNVKQNMMDQDHWYAWNNRNWGVKWDAKDVYFVEPYTEGDTDLNYRFDSPWGIPDMALRELSRQYPTAKLSLEFEEEQGWGGEYVFTNGVMEIIYEYENRCRQCQDMNTMQACEECENYLCSSCNYGEFIEEDKLEQCSIHKDKETVNG
jgi:hypothetical protein